jgi:hypothetical protein
MARFLTIFFLAILALASSVISENNTIGVYETATANLIPYNEHA